MDSFDLVTQEVGRDAANALRTMGLLRLDPDPPLRKGKDMRYLVRCRINPMVSRNSAVRTPGGLIREFAHLAHIQNSSTSIPPYYYGNKPTSFCEKVYEVRGAAYKQYQLACQAQLLAWFIPIQMVPIVSASETNT